MATDLVGAQKEALQRLEENKRLNLTGKAGNEENEGLKAELAEVKTRRDEVKAGNAQLANETRDMEDICILPVDPPPPKKRGPY